MGLVLRRLMNVFRRVFGDGSKVEATARKIYIKFARRSIHGRESTGEVFVRSIGARTSLLVRNDYAGRSTTVFRNGKSDDRVGIYMLGSCGLPSVFVAKPFIRQHLDGLACIIRDGEVADAHSDFLLQLHDNPPPQELAARVLKRMQLPANTFDPKLFAPTFRVPYLNGLGDFPKSAVILSINGDATRTLYRHREAGFLIDPGGWWLRQPMEQVLTNLDKVNWLKKTFEKMPRITVDEFYKSFGRVVRLIKEQTGAEVLVYTAQSLEPGSREHNFGFVKNPQHLRRREMNVAISELSRELDFSLVDVDGILKREGVREQVDFAHFPLEKMEPIAREVTRVLLEREVI